MLLINDIGRHAEAVQDIVSEATNRVVASGWYILGKECQGLEAEFASYCGVEHCIGVANGTDAIEIALRTIGIAPGKRVAMVANAGFYAATAALAIGAELVFIDIDPANWLMSLDDLASVLERQPIDCIVVTHLYGLLHDMEAVMALAGRWSIPVVEDCAQAHGAGEPGRRAGSFGQAATFSFYPTKNLGAIGDGGAVVSRDAEIAQRARRLRQYGWSSKYRVETAGARNSRLDEIQAAVLRAKLPRLDAWNRRRREIATRYSQRIRHPRVSTPPSRGSEYVGHLYVVASEDRDALRQHLAAAGIASDIHYPIPDYRQPAIAGRPWRELPVTEDAARQTLTLPCFPELTDAEVDHVVQHVNGW